MTQQSTAENTQNQEDFTALSFKNVKFWYPESETPAVNNVSFDVRKGEFVSIIGHNGSDKSTLARLICGLLEADEGSITVWGLDLADQKNIFEVRSHTGIVFQNPDNQMVASIVEDDVAFGPENLGVLLLFIFYTGYTPFSVSASFGSTLVCWASLYLKKSVATCGNRA